MTDRAIKTIRMFAALMMFGGVVAGIPLIILGADEDGITSLTALTGMLLIAYALGAVRIWMLTGRPRQESNLRPAG